MIIISNFYSFSGFFIKEIKLKYSYRRNIMKKLLTMSSIFLASLTALTSCGSTGEPYPVEEGATVITIFTRDFEEYINLNFHERVKYINEDLTDGIQVEVQYIRESSFNDKIAAARDANNAPDIYIAAFNHVYQQKIEGLCAPLNSYVSDVALADIEENAASRVCFDGEFYAYPYYSEPSTMLFYRKSKLVEAGIELPKEGETWTWNDLLSACAKLRGILGKGKWPLGMPDSGDIGWASWGMLYNQLQGWPITDNWDESRLAAHHNEMKDFLAYFSALFDNNYAPKQGLTSKGYNNIITALLNDKLAMTLAGGFSLGTVNSEKPELLEDIGVMPCPTYDGDATKVTATNGGWTLMIDAKSKNKEKAGKVIERLLYDVPMDDFVQFFKTSSFCRFSLRKSVNAYIESVITDVERPFYNVTKTVYTNSVFEPLYTWDISNEMGLLLDRCVIGLDAQSYDQQIQYTHNEINRIIAINNMAGTNPHYQN